MREMHDLLVAYAEGTGAAVPHVAARYPQPDWRGDDASLSQRAMSSDRRRPAELDSFELPVPTQVVSNGEYNPLPQNARAATRRGRASRSWRTTSVRVTA